jgi:hypothetical protein
MGGRRAVSARSHLRRCRAGRYYCLRSLSGRSADSGDAVRRAEEDQTLSAPQGTYLRTQCVRTAAEQANIGAQPCGMRLGNATPVVLFAILRTCLLEQGSQENRGSSLCLDRLPWG